MCAEIHGGYDARASWSARQEKKVEQKPSAEVITLAVPSIDMKKQPLKKAA